jgi:hypothetical protein
MQKAKKITLKMSKWGQFRRSKGRRTRKEGELEAKKWRPDLPPLRVKDGWEIGTWKE